MYKDDLLQLSKDTRFRKPETAPDPLSERRNPACGDEVALFGEVGNGKVQNLEFYAQGCAVCVASCTALCQELNGCSTEAARSRINEALNFFEGQQDWQAEWGSPALPALGAVRARQMRMTCVRLAWLALQDVL